ncbi:MAG: hypothetical protein EPO37_02785 [Nitrosarchaeum sp.]|nr:MAG: hypothetical protein EPO37_02785 [Nitrosarchaeum sp.]
MSKNETSTDQHKTINALKENYIRRIDEVDSFYKRFVTMHAEINTEFLYGWLNTAQHYLDLQKKYSSQYPEWISFDISSKIIKQNTEALIQTVHNVDSICIDSMKNMKSNMAKINKSSIQGMQNMERFYDIYKNSNTIQNNNEVMSESKKIVDLK